MPLIDEVDGYNIICKWFYYLKSQDHFINAFVIMPNHVHAIISFIETEQSINNIIGNSKRFMAYCAYTSNYQRPSLGFSRV